MTIQEVLSNHPKKNLSFTPTPFQKLENISRDFNCNLYCKRDDLTGFAFGGNKVRKMEYLIADAIEKQADTIVTSGAYQSNFCRVTAAAGALAGLDVHLVLGGKKGPQMTGNYLLINRLGAHIHKVKSDEWDDRENKRVSLAEELRKQGRNVYEMPIGGSVPIGALGYVAAFYELLDDFKRLDISPSHIIFASSSGGTHAGLLVGKWLSGWKGQITGIGAAKTGGKLAVEVGALAKETAALFNASFTRDDIIIDDEYVGKAYGVPTKECEEAIQYFAYKEGIFLDRVYSGKAAAGVLDYIQKEKVNRKEAVVFIHTGGNVELFA